MVLVGRGRLLWLLATLAATPANAFKNNQHDAASTLAVDADEVCRLAEHHYAEFLPLLGFKVPADHGLYPIEVHRNEKHYRRRLKVEGWSGGLTAWNHIYVYAGPGLNSTLAHEIVHLIMNENLRSRAFGQLSWLSEGLAAVLALVTTQLLPESSDPPDTWYGIRSDARPFEQMTGRDLRLSKKREDYVRWHDQASSVTWFLIRRCGMSGMRELLRAIASQPRFSLEPYLDKALPQSCGGRWASMKELERDWLGQENRPATPSLAAYSQPNASLTPNPAP